MPLGHLHVGMTLIQNGGYFWLKTNYYVYLLGAKRRFGQSTDCPAQSMDQRFAQPIHGLFSIQTRVSERSFPAAIEVYRSAAMVDREARLTYLCHLEFLSGMNYPTFFLGRERFRGVH